MTEKIINLVPDPSPTLSVWMYEYLESVLKYAEANAQDPTTTVSINVGRDDQPEEDHIVFCRKSTWEMLNNG